jgi:hypothetical protein
MSVPTLWVDMAAEAWHCSRVITGLCHACVVFFRFVTRPTHCVSVNWPSKHAFHFHRKKNLGLPFFIHQKPTHVREYLNALEQIVSCLRYL